MPPHEERREDASEQLEDNEARDEAVRQLRWPGRGEVDGGACAAFEQSAAEGDQRVPRAVGYLSGQHDHDWLRGADRQGGASPEAHALAQEMLRGEAEA
jgi:hypothetical protein